MGCVHVSNPTRISVRIETPPVAAPSAAPLGRSLSAPLRRRPPPQPPDPSSTRRFTIAPVAPAPAWGCGSRPDEIPGRCINPLAARQRGEPNGHADAADGQHGGAQALQHRHRQTGAGQDLHLLRVIQSASRSRTFVIAAAGSIRLAQAGKRRQCENPAGAWPSQGAGRASFCFPELIAL